MPFQVSPLEIIVVLVLVLVIFGPKRLPEMGKSLGRSIKEFRRSVSRDEPEVEKVEPGPAGSPAPAARAINGKSIGD